MTGRNEGVRRDEAGTTDAEGFIAPSVGLVEHALYFTSAPDVLAKTLQVLDAGRLELPGAVVVWDETVGRRTGSKAVAGAWWATSGSVTMSLVFPAAMVRGTQHGFEAVVHAVLDAVNGFQPDPPASLDGDGTLVLGGQRLGSVSHVTHGDDEVFVVRIHANTDFAKAPAAVRDGDARLADAIDVAALPLGSASTLANSLSLAILQRVPQTLGWS